MTSSKKTPAQKTPAWILERAKSQQQRTRLKRDWLSLVKKAKPELYKEILVTAADWLADGDIRKMCPTPSSLGRLFCSLEGVKASEEAIRHWAARLERDPERLNGYQ